MKRKPARRRGAPARPLPQAQTDSEGGRAWEVPDDAVPAGQVQTLEPDDGAWPYDQGLLDRCRDHWRRGAWAELAGMTVDAIERHPQRARLALMVASAHQALGQAAPTRLFVQLSRQWGAEPELVTRVLIAGVHTTLGRATALSPARRGATAYHFREAVAAGTPRSARLQATRLRAEAQLADIQLAELVPALLSGGVGVPAARPQVASPLVELRRTVQQQSEAIAEIRKEQAVLIDGARRGIENSVKRASANTIRQVEEFNNLQSFLSGREVAPELHGWPVSPDVAMLLVRLIQTQHFDAIVEFGSGSSTMLMARAQATQMERGRIDALLPQIAFEHLDTYHRGTQQLLEKFGHGRDVQLVLAPLAPLAVGEEQFPYYSCMDALRDLAQRLRHIAEPRLLVFVDGPPAATGPLARYPALAAVTSAIPAAGGLLLLDDYERIDERAIAKRWMDDLTREGRAPEMTEHTALEKMAMAIGYRGLPAGADATGASA